MTDHHEAPDADLADQTTPAVPEGEDNEGTVSVRPMADSVEADPADAWEQALPAASETDDEYDYQAPGEPGPAG